MVPLENLLVGYGYILISLFFVSTNGLVGFALLRHKEYHSTTYRIVLHMLFGSIMQLSSHIVGGVITVRNGGFPILVERIAGAWMQSGWFVYLVASLALAIDRALTFIRIFSERTTILITWGFLALSWLCGLIYLVGLLLPDFGFNYYTENGYGFWFYDDHMYSHYLELLEMILDFSTLVSVLVLYIVVFARILTMRTAVSSGLSSSVRELRILAIAVVSFLYECTFLLWFFWGSKLMNEGMLSSTVVTLLWIVDCGLFSLATIAINASIRRNIVHLFIQKHRCSTVVQIDLRRQTSTRS